MFISDFVVLAAFWDQFVAASLVSQNFTSNFTSFFVSTKLSYATFPLIDDNFCTVWSVIIDLDLINRTVPGQNYLFNYSWLCDVCIF